MFEIRANVSFVGEERIASICNYTNFEDYEKLSFLVGTYRVYGFA